ncbi:hypothetical protein LHA31_02715 [Carnobacterium viridans]|uniref:Uncharacterized protein n=1 Tax=Carnobacterium viridans TaxID=174587 RepID=A0A1H1BPA0_9LACT|nr:hypothetical protein [Carnobacterium viridans]UDE95707.1 hypothetical protein LHA31_02715 [Carnobacterium viridans]SDQ53709.1 hypothetical protein SAMN04487752_2674 [Carnobacterium viridans]SDQ55193.1 hypothetical protein SAMN04487752_2734 [Carnobacterium viridans]
MTIGELKELLKDSEDIDVVLVEIGGSRLTGGDIRVVDGAEKITEKGFAIFCNSVEPTEEEIEDWKFIHKSLVIKEENN